MKIVEETLSIPLDFRFPYIPYPIQNELMKKIFEAIENGGLGLFESPTGTVSIIYTLNIGKLFKDNE
jgi:Rad3-related DNA helicase